MKVALAQIRYRWSETPRDWRDGQADNIDKAVDFIRRAGREGGDVVTFSEYFLGNARPMPLDSPVIRRLADTTRDAGVYTITGATRLILPERGKRGKPKLASLVIAPTGKIVSIHAKQVLYPFERTGFEPGQNKVARIGGRKVGIVAGHELLQPGLVEKLIKQGAELIVAQLVASREMPYMLETLQSAIRAYAASYLVPVAAVAQLGEYFGESIFVGGSIAAVPETVKFQGKITVAGARIAGRLGEYENLLIVDLNLDTRQEIGKRFQYA